MKNRIMDKLAGKSRGNGLPADTEETSSSVTELAKHQLDQARQEAEKFVSTHPLICLGAAVATGIAVGWWVKRR